MPLDGTIPTPAGLFRESTGSPGSTAIAGDKLITALVWGFIYAVALASILLLPKLLTRSIKRRAPLILLLILVFLSASWSPFPGKVILDGMQLLGALAICVLAAHFYKNNTALLFKHASFALGINLTIQLILINMLPGQTIHYDGRWAGATGSANYLGALSFCCIWASLAWIHVEGAKNILMPLFFITVAFVDLVGTNSVTSTLTSLITISLFTYSWSSRPTKWRVAKETAFYLAVILITFIALSAGLSFWLEFAGRTEGASGRDVIWLAAIDLIRAKPFIGHGFGSDTETLGALHWATTFHNGYLEIGVKLGFVGLLLFVYLLYQAFRDLIADKYTRSIRMVFAIFFVSYLFYNLAETATLLARNPMWIMFLTLILTIGLRDKECRVNNGV